MTKHGTRGAVLRCIATAVAASAAVALASCATSSDRKTNSPTSPGGSSTTQTAQTGALSVTVRAAGVTLTNVPFVVIAADSTTTASSTGSSGTAIIQTIALGTAQVIVSVTGYVPQTANVTIVANQTASEVMALVATSTGGGSSASAQISFWTNANLAIAAKIDGVSAGTLNQYFSTGTPACGQSGTVTVSVSPGTHQVSGASSGLTWGPGSVTVSAGQCFLYEFTGPSGSSGNAQISFWTNAAISGGITAKLDGVTAGTLSQYFPAGTPTCGQVGTLTITVAPGTHQLSASATGYTWNPTTVTVTAGECLMFEFTASGGGGG